MQTSKSDTELLRDYGVNKSEAAFGEIVRRYADFVYSAALRQTGNPEPARDVAQIVFTDLARKADSLPASTLLIGWLCHGARLAALDQRRRDRRRLHRERQAMEWHGPSSEVANDWGEIRPVLDEALASLGDEDRNALLLRFFKNENLTSVGMTLGVSEDAAQKRTNMKTAIITLALAGGIAGLAYQQLNTQRLLRSARASADQQAEEIRGLRAANEQLVSQTNELKTLREEARDVLRLRAEVARLRQEQAALKRTAAQIAQAETNDLPKTEERPIRITAKFISIPTENLKGSGWVKTPNGGVELMDGAQIRALEKMEGIEILSSPRVQTANGVEASVSVTQQVPVGGTNANVGTTLNVNPHYSTNSSTITLDLSAALSRIVDTSLQQDESQRDLQITTITNSVTISDGQSILLRGDLTDEGRVIGSTNQIAGPKSLLVVLMPQILHEDGTYFRLERSIKIGDPNK